MNTRNFISAVPDRLKERTRFLSDTPVTGSLREHLNYANWPGVKGKRLREAKNNAKHAQEASETLGKGDTHTQDGESQVPVSDDGPRQLLVCSHDIVGLSSSNSDTTESSDPLALHPFDIGDLQFCPNFIGPQPRLPSLSPTIQPQFPMTVYSALYINGEILGLTCGTTIPGKSTPAGPNVPLPLHPTQLQLMTIHPRWIDRLPFPKVRDSMITLSGIMDDEEFVKDVFTMPSFEIVPGRMPWDPTAWKILKVFADKWGYLFV